MKTHPIKQGSVLIITGASSGLGKQLALAYSKRKLKILIAGRDNDRLSQTKRQCISKGNSEIEIFVGDITDQDTCTQLIKHTVQKYKKIDAIILNAGINSHFEFKDLKDTKIFHTLMNTNFHANVNLTQAVLPFIKKSGGKIIVISSLSGKFGLPSRSAYCASKFALTGFFQSLRVEQQVDIIMVYPTSLQTPMRKNNIVITSHDKANEKNANLQNQNQTRQDPRKCAQNIVKSIDNDKKDIYIPIKGLLGVILQPIFPNFIRQKLKTSAKL